MYVWFGFIFSVLPLTAFASLQFGAQVYKANVDENWTGLLEITVEAYNTAQPNDTITYSIMTSDTSNHFLVNETSGNISVKVAFDREMTPEVNLTVIAQCCSNLTASAVVLVTVNDIDDNPPRFENVKEPVIVTFTQSFSSREYRSLPTATDPDLEQHVEYKPVFSSYWADYFTVNKTTAELSTLESCNSACHKDFTEGDDFTFQFSLLAFTPGDLANRSEILITVNLTYEDPNLHSPVFEKDTYAVGLAIVTQPEGQVILTVKANDRDSGVDGEIEYKMAPDTPVRTKSIFDVGPHGGDVRYNQKVDPQENYTFVILATDKGVRRRSGQTEVAIFVTGIEPEAQNEAKYAAIALGATLLVAVVVGAVFIRRIYILEKQLKKEKDDKENLIRLFRSVRVSVQANRSRRPGSEHFDNIDESRLDNYEHLPNLPLDNDMSHYNNNDRRESDYLHSSPAPEVTPSTNLSLRLPDYNTSASSMELQAAPAPFPNDFPKISLEGESTDLDYMYPTPF